MALVTLTLTLIIMKTPNTKYWLQWIILCDTHALYQMPEVQFYLPQCAREKGKIVLKNWNGIFGVAVFTHKCKENTGIEHYLICHILKTFARMKVVNGNHLEEFRTLGFSGEGDSGMCLESTTLSPTINLLFRFIRWSLYGTEQWASMCLIASLWRWMATVPFTWIFKQTRGIGFKVACDSFVIFKDSFSKNIKVDA